MGLFNNGMILIAYGVGENFKNKNDSELSFSFVADIKFEDKRINSFEGVPVMHFDQLEMITNACIVVFPENHEVYKEVCDRYQSKERDVYIWYIDDYMHFIDYQRGLHLCLKYNLFDTKGVYYFVLKYHVGDIAIALPYIGMFKELHNCPSKYNMSILLEFEEWEKVDKIIVLTEKKYQPLVRMCKDVDEIILLSEKELNAVCCYASEGVNVKNLYPDWAGNDNIRKRPFSDDRYYFNWLYGIPCHNDYVDAYLNNYSFIVKSYIKESVAILIAERRLDIDRMIILCPYAKSTSMLSFGFWERYAEWLNHSGYEVYTNCAPGEVPVQGTIELCLKVDELCALAQMGVYIVGVQSGIMDALKKVFPRPKLLVLSLYNTDCDKVFCLFYRLKKNVGSKSVDTNYNGCSKQLVCYTDDEQIIMNELLKET